MTQADSTHESIALTIRRHVEAAPGRLDALATALDMPANVLKLVMEGKMKLPGGKVPPLARVLNVHPADLMRRLLQEYDPSGLKVLEEVWPALSLTSNQRRLLDLYARVAKGNDAYPVLVSGVALVIAKDSRDTDSEL